jgi:hypothetical protein
MLGGRLLLSRHLLLNRRLLLGKGGAGHWRQSR